ncbi:MAG: tRNA pseudouridine(38-40) synthase TruA [Saprospiraceae bacterium]|jgi:tRNA pseudouridine38-40 synthase|nr:tRNA pseudouridine(38-40) synthase TruA [Saprospiraceae bacterium]MBL0023523.1 tRNA pseudouridine(38-40) synthase TruA [Saprospiraceae bacterium]
MRYFLHLAYLGTAYNGWQKQINTQLCVQQILENALQKMTGEGMSVMGCGRTDTGVHAKQFFAHFDYEPNWNYDPVERLNRMLPDDISVFEIIPVEKRAHTRYDATFRSYEYHVHLEKNPYLARISTYLDTKKLDFEAIRKGLESIRNTTDFRHLCLTPDRYKNTICRISVAELEVSADSKMICFRFTANRFLKSMIRIMVARLIALGEGKIDLDTFADAQQGNQKLRFRTLAFPCGLHLSKVVYPYLEREVKASFTL